MRCQLFVHLIFSLTKILHIHTSVLNSNYFPSHGAPEYAYQDEPLTRASVSESSVQQDTDRSHPSPPAPKHQQSELSQKSLSPFPDLLTSGLLQVTRCPMNAPGKSGQYGAAHWQRERRRFRRAHRSSGMMSIFLLAARLFLQFLVILCRFFIVCITRGDEFLADFEASGEESLWDAALDALSTSRPRAHPAERRSNPGSDDSDSDSGPSRPSSPRPAVSGRRSHADGAQSPRHGAPVTSNSHRQCRHHHDAPSRVPRSDSPAVQLEVCPPSPELSAPPRAAGVSSPHEDDDNNNSVHGSMPGLLDVSDEEESTLSASSPLAQLVAGGSSSASGTRWYTVFCGTDVGVFDNW